MPTTPTLSSLLEVGVQATQDDVDVVGDVLGVHLFGADEGVERSSVAGAKLHGVLESVDGLDDVVVGRERVRHLPSGTENGTQVPGDVLHHRLFGDEEVRLVGHVFGLVVVQIGHVVSREDLVRGLFGADCSFSLGDDDDTRFLAGSGRQDDRLVNAVRRFVQV